ncbi:mandelate racemase/muconate lactonizing enzyme family protein [Geminicoccaceae bacterium 1502E]|nr:mandelate racemase/muconate lactonizing enzyme family protein [Geminicoccaceae bacterium 1502E]
MKIRSVQAHILEAPLERPFAWSFSQADRRQSVLVEITTEDGVTGWGECYGYVRPTAAMVETMAGLLAGEDALATERLWQKLHNAFRDQGQRGIVIAALSGIDIALWDIKGKALGQSVHRLMGGPIRERVRAYATGLYRRFEGDPVEYLAEEAGGYAAEGFAAVKLKVGFGIAEDLRNAKAVREAIGPEVGLMVDANHGYDVAHAARLGRALAELDVGWFEEPVVPEDVAGYAELRHLQPVPVAGGECSFTRWDFGELFTRRALDVVQPDLCGVGGLSEGKKIADMAAAFGVRCVPHVWGTGIGLAAALQFLAVLPSNPPVHRPVEPMLEFDRTEHPFRQAVLAEPLEHSDGWVDVPTRPGLGIEIDRKALVRFTLR